MHANFARNILTAGAALLIVAFALTATTAESADKWIASILQSTPTLSKEEMKQTLFLASFSVNNAPGTIECSLYNPSRDKTIRGIVVNVHGKDAGSGEEQSIDLFVDVSCGPLQCAEKQQYFKVLEGMAKGSPAIALKEMHYQAVDVAGAAPTVLHWYTVTLAEGTTSRTFTGSSESDADQLTADIFRPDGFVALDKLRRYEARDGTNYKWVADEPGKQFIAGRSVLYFRELAADPAAAAQEDQRK